MASGARAAVSGGTWGSAIEVPGTATLDKGGNASVASLSCRSTGNCSAGGSYTDSSQQSQVFVVTETNGTWGTAQEAPGTATLNKGGNAAINSLSCGAAGNCSAGGSYKDASGHIQAFVVGQANGTWGSAKEVPGLTTLNKGGGAAINSVSCASARNCAAGGYYTDSSGHGQAFGVNEINSIWGTAKEVPGTASLNKGGTAEITSVSCGSAGNCSAGGQYSTGSSSHEQVFVVGEANGVWGTAQEVPGTAALNQRGFASISSVSCASAGNCSAGGSYDDSSFHLQAFVVNEINGVWGTATEVPGTASLNKGGTAEITSVSCMSAGNCSAGGQYTAANNGQEVFVVGETNGTWGKAEKVLPGTAALNLDGNAQLTSLSCGSAGNCSAGGPYLVSDFNGQAWVVTETNGTWGKAEKVPGLTTLNKGKDAWIDAVSCSSAGHCSAGGYYATVGAHTLQAFVVNET
jgi:hypothetical protein